MKGLGTSFQASNLKQPKFEAWKLVPSPFMTLTKNMLEMLFISFTYISPSLTLIFTSNQETDILILIFMSIQETDIMIITFFENHQKT